MISQVFFQQKVSFFLSYQNPDELFQKCQQMEKQFYDGYFLYKFLQLESVEDETYFLFENDLQLDQFMKKVTATFLVQQIKENQYILAVQTNKMIPNFFSFQNGQCYIICLQTQNQIKPIFQKYYLIKINLVQYYEGASSFVAAGQVIDNVIKNNLQQQELLQYYIKEF